MSEHARKPFHGGWAITSAVLAVTLLPALPARAQWIPCLGDPTISGKPPTPIPLPTIPELELGAKKGKLRATVLLTDEQQRLTFKTPPGAPPSDTNVIKCAPQYVRVFKGLDAVPPYPKKTGDYPDPMPGPTFRARIGDLVELTLINQINPVNFGNSIDRGDSTTGSGCDETSVYPGKAKDTYPDCFHGSSTANIHFHGTHTNPNSTGDNVFLEIRPSLRVDGKAVVTPASVKGPFDKFFAQCEQQLQKSVLSQWPLTWSDLPAAYPQKQEELLKKYDRTPNIKKLWPVNAAQLKKGYWPQYYIGAYPYCFRLPEFTGAFPPPAPSASSRAAHTGGPLREAAARPLMMGQAPGTHWYHAHKHGSTAIDVANGMTGAFIIEGKYDDELDNHYGAGWTRKQPVLVINQIGVTPNLERGGGGGTDKGPDFSVNGRLRPVMSMQPGEVKLWRIVNTSGRAGAFFVDIVDAGGKSGGFQWKQLAQDGVQFNDTNYQNSKNPTFLVAPGNRVDLLVMAPAASGTYRVLVQNEVDPTDLLSQEKTTLFSVSVAGAAADLQFISHAPSFPAFLTDIKPGEVKGTKTVTFASTPPIAQHTIDGKKFNGEVGEVVLLNHVEEWKVYNRTFGAIPPANGPPMISHPFHIHINPFQVVEVFNPAETITVNGQTVRRYVFDNSKLQPGQCYLDPNGNPDDYKPCGPSPAQSNLIWWDVFPIPSGILATDAKGKQIKVPGWFKLRSRFVDYSGYYVIHCHILAHEDRGMMTVVEVAPITSPYAHE